MRLSHDEERFLRHWMHDELHYREGQGLAKRLQLLHRVIPADLATLIAAAIPGSWAAGFASATGTKAPSIANRRRRNSADSSAGSVGIYPQSPRSVPV